MWIATTAPYKSGDDTMDALGIEWSWGVGRKSLIGKLYGIKDGEDVLRVSRVLAAR